MNIRHFVVEIVYISPIEKIESLTEEHRAYLAAGYQKGMLLLSGPKIPRTGGIVIARATSFEEIELFFKNDPYAVNNAATYNFIEFNLKSHQPFLESWLG